MTNENPLSERTGLSTGFWLFAIGAEVNHETTGYGDPTILQHSGRARK